MLHLDNISYCWPNAAQETISQLSLNIAAGEWVALVGDNGAGKSTLLRLTAGLLHPTHGDVKLNGNKVSQYKAAQRASHIGVLFQEVEKQVFYSSVKDEVAFGLRRQKLPSHEIEQRTLEALEICSLLDVADTHPLDLNTGQRRMVAVASLSAIAPKILLLDEPSRDFDAHWLECFEHWLEMQRAVGTAIFAISHDLDFVARHFERVIHLSAGKLIDDGAPETVLLHPDLQPDTVLPAPTLFSLSHALNLELESDPKQWAEKFITKPF
ncbi:energy-coupling factor transport system ATP-binding protein [Providencia alcalifaciens]|nr:energy-coupling factor transport system ATP-binding protein [Providencia alcalifaciens]